MFQRSQGVYLQHQFQCIFIEMRNDLLIDLLDHRSNVVLLFRVHRQEDVNQYFDPR